MKKNILKYLLLILFPLSLCSKSLIEYPLNLPGIGNIKLKGDVNLETSEFSLNTKKNINLKKPFFTIKTINAKLSNKTGLSVDASIEILGKKEILKLEKLIPKKETIYNITFSKPLTLSITPKNKIIIKKLTWKHTNQTSQLYTDIEIFNQKATMLFGIHKTTRKTFGQLEINQISLSRILSLPKETSFKTAKFDIKIQIEEPFKKNVAHPFSINGKSNTTIYPFSNIPGINLIPSLKNSSVKNLAIQWGSNKEISLTGKTKIFNIKSDVSLILAKQLTAKIYTTTNMLSKLIPIFDKKPLSDIKLSNSVIILAQEQYYDQKLKQHITKGITISSEVTLGNSKELQNVKSILPNIPEKLPTLISIGTILKNIKIAIQLPGKLKLSNNITLGNLNLVISAIDIEIQGQIKRKTHAKKYLIINTSIGIKPDGINLSGGMKGSWKNALGTGITIEDIGIEGTWEPGAPVPSEIGIIGTFKFGNKKINLAFKYDLLGNIVLMGKYNGKLLFEDLLDISKKINKNIPIQKIKNIIPDYGIEHPNFKFAPITTKIAGITVEKGITANGKIDIYGTKLNINLNIGGDGIKFKGEVGKIDFGPLKIEGPKNHGPTLDLALTTKEQHLIFDGKAKILGAESNTKVHLKRSEIDFYSKIKIIKGLKLTLEGKSKGSIKNPKKLDFQIHGKFENNLINYLVDKITGQLPKAIKNILKTISKTMFNITKIEVKGSLKDLEKAKLPTFTVGLTMMGLDLEFKLNLDLKDPTKIIDSLTSSIKKSAKKFFKPYNVVVHNKTKYSVKLTYSYHIIGIPHKASPIEVKSKSFKTKFQQKNIRWLNLYIRKNRKWKKMLNVKKIDTSDFYKIHIYIDQPKNKKIRLRAYKKWPFKKQEHILTRNQGQITKKKKKKTIPKEKQRPAI